MAARPTSLLAAGASENGNSTTTFSSHSSNQPCEKGVQGTLEQLLGRQAFALVPGLRGCSERC